MISSRFRRQGPADLSRADAAEGRRGGLTARRFAEAYCETVGVVSGTSSRSMTARQGALSLALFARMQTVIFGMLGISEAQRRNASPVQAARASALNAKLDVDAATEAEMIKAAVRHTLRMELIVRIGNSPLFVE